MAGFTGATNNPSIGSQFHQFDDGVGTQLPLETDGDGFLNEEIRSVVLAKLNAIPEYVALFADAFNSGVASGFEIEFFMVGQALSEFQTSLTFANAPIDRFARGDSSAMTEAQKHGALLFFGKAQCVECHAVAGPSNEMFSDFQNRVLAVPQIAPLGFGVGLGNVLLMGRTTTRISAPSRFRATPTIGTSSERLHCETRPYSRRSSTTGRSRGSKMPYAITSTS